MTLGRGQRGRTRGNRPVLAAEESTSCTSMESIATKSSPSNGPPALVTLHLPPEWYPRIIWTQSEHSSSLRFGIASRRSAPNRRSFGQRFPEWIDLDSFRPRTRKCGFALMLGRICPGERLPHRDRRSHGSRMPRWIGGEVFGYEAHLRYFVEQIVPRLTGSTRPSMAGPTRISGANGRLTASRLASSYPSTAPETSPSLPWKQLACGTPVIAFRSGSPAGDRRGGRTGFVVGTAAKWRTQSGK